MTDWPILNSISNWNWNRKYFVCPNFKFYIKIIKTFSKLVMPKYKTVVFVVVLNFTIDAISFWQRHNIILPAHDLWMKLHNRCGIDDMNRLFCTLFCGFCLSYIFFVLFCFLFENEKWISLFDSWIFLPKSEKLIFILAPLCIRNDRSIWIRMPCKL